MFENRGRFRRTRARGESAITVFDKIRKFPQNGIILSNFETQTKKYKQGSESAFVLRGLESCIVQNKLCSLSRIRRLRMPQLYVALSGSALVSRRIRIQQVLFSSQCALFSLSNFIRKTRWK